MSEHDEEEGRPTPRTPPTRQREIIRRSAEALERIGQTYAARKQRCLLARLEAGLAGGD